MTEHNCPWGPVVVMDTSTATLNVGVVQSGKPAVQKIHSHDSHRWHSARLIPALQKVLEQAGVETSAIQAVACTTGPGSFTGLRTGLTCAKTLAYGLQLPVIAISTLEWWLWAAVLQGWVQPGQRVAVMLDAMRGRAYTATAIAPNLVDALHVQPAVVQPMACHTIGPDMLVCADAVLADASIFPMVQASGSEGLSQQIDWHVIPDIAEMPTVSAVSVLGGLLNAINQPLSETHPLVAGWESLSAEYVQPPSITLPKQK